MPFTVHFEINLAKDGIAAIFDTILFYLEFQGCRAPLQAWTSHFAKSHVTMLFTSACSQVIVMNFSCLSYQSKNGSTTPRRLTFHQPIHVIPGSSRTDDTL